MNNFAITLRRVAVLAVFGVTAFAVGSAEAQEKPEDDPQVIEVDMKNYGFAPADIVANPGDTVKFVNITNEPHNVEFKDVPEGMVFPEKSFPMISAKDTLTADPPPRMGPYVLGEDGVYQIVIGDDWPEGVYNYVCTPHESLGMKAKMTVKK